jgi:hypothetical protein
MATGASGLIADRRSRLIRRTLLTEKSFSKRAAGVRPNDGTNQIRRVASARRRSNRPFEAGPLKVDRLIDLTQHSAF